MIMSPSRTSHAAATCAPVALLSLVVSLLLFRISGVVAAGKSGPNFVGGIANVTITEGRDAVLTCQVEHLKGYKVAWVQVETQTILTIHTNVITRNPRVGLSHEGHNVFRLHLKSVTEGDRGYYMCQINTDPMINQKGFLQVVVPPDIDDAAWTGDLVVRENSNVTLECKARGYPPPVVTWKREEQNSKALQSDNIVEGQSLEIRKVSRLHMGAYLCVASNGIQPSVSKRIQLRVQFPPMLWIPNQLEGARMGEKAVLECHTEAFPKSINYWTNHKGEMIASTGVSKYDTQSREDSYKTYMKLVIHNLTAEDFNTYKCIAKNSLGDTDGSIRLYAEMEPKSGKELSTQESMTKAQLEEEGGELDISGDVVDVSTEDMEKNYATERRGRPKGKHPSHKKTGRGPNSWRSGEAVNEVFSEVDEVFRKKDNNQKKDLTPGRDIGSSFDHSYSYDAAGSSSHIRIPLIVFFVSVFLLLCLGRL